MNNINKNDLIDLVYIVLFFIIFVLCVLLVIDIYSYNDSILMCKNVIKSIEEQKIVVENASSVLEQKKKSLSVELLFKLVLFPFLIFSIIKKDE